MLPFLALKVLILAGGLNPEQNHHSHRVHVEALQGLLAARGVPAEDVAVFWADGVDPKPDRAVVREAPPADFWLIEGLRFSHEVDPGPELENTVFSPAAQPASRAALKTWLAQQGATLRRGDTLLIAVTDHGSPDPAGGSLSRIELWAEETWNPAEMLEDLAPISEEVRVVLWMSQCHSGGFADLFRQRQNLCGAFSASADRVAYGCYPELAGRPDVGHFQRMVEALAQHGQLAAASDAVLLSDDTPDVPHLTSDALLYGSLVNAAQRAGVELGVFVDTRLTEDEATSRRAAELALRYGLGGLRDHSAVLDLLEVLGAARFAVQSWAEVWMRAYDVARELLVEEAARRTGEPRTRAQKLKARAKMVSEAAKAWQAAPAELRARVQALRGKVEAALRLEARLDQQEAAALRVAWLQGRSAGLSVLSQEERLQLEALRACETTPLLPPSPVVGPLGPEPTPLPPAARALAEAEALRPGHLGLAFRDRPKFQGVEVERLLPGSVLLALDLRPGDLISAVNGQPIQRRGAFREAVMLTEPGTPLRLSGSRGKTPLEVALPSPPMPLPAPTPLIGEPVGDLRLRPLDAPLPPLGEGQETVLFFWATWCKPCKAALPALKSWALNRRARVVAITDEDPTVVQKFLSGFGAFPFVIALDVEDEAGRLFGVQQVPVFVLLDAQRRLVQVEVGFEDRIRLGER